MNTVTTAGPAVIPTFVHATDTLELAEFEAWKAIDAKRAQYNYGGLDPHYLTPETRRLYEVLEDEAATLAERYAVAGPADTISAWVTYFLEQFERKLDDPAKASACLADLQRDLAARVEQGGW